MCNEPRWECDSGTDAEPEISSPAHPPTVRQCYEEVARQAERESLSYERYLHELVQRECEERQENRITKMLRESQLPLEKSLEAFDTKRLPAKAARQMRSLLDGSFLERTDNVLVFGNPGSGKTHMLQAISQELVRRGIACSSQVARCLCRNC